MIIERTINSAIVDEFKDSLGGLVITLPGQFLGIVDKILTLLVGHLVNLWRGIFLPHVYTITYQAAAWVRGW